MTDINRNTPVRGDAPGRSLETLPDVTTSLPYGFGTPAEPEKAASLREYVAVLYRRRWLAFTVFALVMALAAVGNFMAVSTYEASARVLVNPERLNLVKIEDVVSQQRSVDTELAILRSRWLAKETVASLGLVPQGLATIAAPPAEVSTDAQRGGLWSKVKSGVSAIVGTPPPPPRPAIADSLAGESPAEAKEIDGFLAGLTVTLTNDGVLDIRYRSGDPVKAARYANAHAQSYIKQNAVTRFAAVQEAAEWLRDRLDEQKRKVDASEHAVLAFQEEHGLMSAAQGAVAGTSIVAARLTELSASITRAQSSRLERDSEYSRAMTLRGNPDELDRLPQMLASPPLQQLRGELDRLQQERTRLAKSLRDAHPDMIKIRDAIDVTQTKLGAERTRVIEGLRQELVAARATENGLTAELDKLKREAAEQNRGTVQLDILRREAESNRQIYDMLMQRARETGVAKEATPDRTRILDPALVPIEPVSPNKIRNLLQALLWAVGLALVAAFGLERLDNRVKLPGEIERRLGIPFLGLIPEVKIAEGERIPLATDGVGPQFAEEMRRIRTNLLFSLTGDAVRIVAVTSSGASEGKTVVASNLALTLAQTGQRVLLIDADLRRPAVHTSFSIAQEPGLTNVLVGTSKASDAIHRTLPGLWILPSGRRPPNPSELLSSHQFQRFLTNLTEYFDWVIIDGPPVIPVTDACVLAHFVSGMLFVVGAERTTHQVARRAVEQLNLADAKIMGGILNRVDVARHSYYYGTYYDAYRRKYSDYYNEPPAASA
jgi:capsular exopolysaccharide synthesis family protein